MSGDDIVNLVESIDPYELEPSMTAEDRYKLSNELHWSLSDKGISEEEIGELNSTITELSSLLTGTVADDLYKNLINKSDPKWDALEVSSCYYAREKLESITYLASNHQPLLDDLKIVIDLCEEGVEQRDILKIVDAHLQNKTTELSIFLFNSCNSYLKYNHSQTSILFIPLRF